MHLVDRISKAVIAFMIAMAIYVTFWFTAVTHPHCRNAETWMVCVTMGDRD